MTAAAVADENCAVYELSAPSTCLLVGALFSLNLTFLAVVLYHSLIYVHKISNQIMYFFLLIFRLRFVLSSNCTIFDNCRFGTHKQWAAKRKRESKINTKKI